MILLLNLIPVIIVVSGAALAWKYRSWKVAAVALALLAIYVKAQPSYMPKGVVERSAIPAFERAGSVEDRLSKPVPGAERDQAMKERVQKGLDFIEK